MHKITILINGKKRSGKDFCAGELKRSLESRGKTVQVLSIAAPSKRIVQSVFNITPQELDYFKNNQKDIKDIKDIKVRKLGVKLVDLDFRQILQRLGTDSLSEMFGEHIWVDLLKEEIRNSTTDFVIFSDFRFKKEHISTETVKIKNDCADTTDSHSSENELNDFNFKYTIDNTNYQDITDQIEKLTNTLIHTERKGLRLNE